ncbi:RimJ/RimL family protein N-acetyltransferase [Pedobacter sp. AK013]|uniref:GNAT family N-acetyltransferase n=1 Tax=Pedobacter sp. AK013 TaxID=2723071 RepID=UPI001615CB6B|nr:GNAT family N-acetyltransferase [Pedobacter sp. AK013]MBB6236758.1 RimJ/RimL family protein N-acetyltransferase [Pedobacter sp. AK013]
MAYDINLMADTELFEKIRFISVGEDIILKPTMIEVFDQEAAMYLLNSKTVGVKKYLPSVYVETIEEAKKKLLNFSEKMLLRGSILYGIRQRKMQAPMGYIHLNTPLMQTGLNSWTLDFWLGENAQGKGLMTASLYYVLQYLQNYGVSEIKALVHSDNEKSINVLERLGFGKINQESGGEQRFLYVINL